MSGESFGRGPGAVQEYFQNMFGQSSRNQTPTVELVLIFFGTLGWEKFVGCFDFLGTFFELQLCWQAAIVQTQLTVQNNPKQVKTKGLQSLKFKPKVQKQVPTLSSNS